MVPMLTDLKYRGPIVVFTPAVAATDQFSLPIDLVPSGADVDRLNSLAGP